MKRPLQLLLASVFLGALMVGGCSAESGSNTSDGDGAGEATTGSDTTGAEGATVGGDTTTGTDAATTDGAGSTGDIGIDTGVDGTVDGISDPDNHPFPEAWGVDSCPDAPSGVTQGYAVGDQLAEIKVADCDGNEVFLSDFCGADGMWVFAAHGWCPHCKKAAGFAEDVHDFFWSEGSELATVVILVQSGSNQPPTKSDCSAFRQQMDHDNVVTLYASTGQANVLWQNNLTALSVFVDGNRVITNKANTDVQGQIESEIQKAISQ